MFVILITIRNFKIPVHFTDNVEMFFNDMIVLIVKEGKLKKSDINDFYYYYVIFQFINGNSKRLVVLLKRSDIKNLLLLTCERLLCYLRGRERYKYV